MKTFEISLAQIGNSRGIRLPAGLIRKHGLVIEDRGHEIALKPKRTPRKLSWEETAHAMVVAGEDWSRWDVALADGLDDIPWAHPVPAEVKKHAKARRRSA
jgi:antitoxin component of MazEF toxin-antitoxin module